MNVKYLWISISFPICINSYEDELSNDLMTKLWLKLNQADKHLNYYCPDFVDISSQLVPAPTFCLHLHCWASCFVIIEIHHKIVSVSISIQNKMDMLTTQTVARIFNPFIANQKKSKVCQHRVIFLDSRQWSWDCLYSEAVCLYIYTVPVICAHVAEIGSC